MISFDNLNLLKSKFFCKFLAGKILFPGLDPYFIYAIESKAFCDILSLNKKDGLWAGRKT